MDNKLTKRKLLEGLLRAKDKLNIKKTDKELETEWLGQFPPSERGELLLYLHQQLPTCPPPPLHFTKEQRLEEGAIDTMTLYGFNTFKTEKRMKEPKLKTP